MYVLGSVCSPGAMFIEDVNKAVIVLYISDLLNNKPIRTDHKV
jgi:hypothetical protein